MTIDMSILTRIEMFQSIIASAECTDGKSKKKSLDDGLEAIKNYLDKAKNNDNSIYIVGNGGSAGIASHVVNDMINVAKLKAFTFHDISLLTCMANDYGYENVYAEPLRNMLRKGDMLIAISSSGKSNNIINATKMARLKGANIITFSGFEADNELRKQGDLNIYLSSNDYGFVEYGHAFILHNITDRFM
jgi:D-sedoheptulose 7-phosphate isomerase